MFLKLITTAGREMFQDNEWLQPVLLFVDLVKDFEGDIKDMRVCDSIANESTYNAWLPIHQNQKKDKYRDLALR